MKGYGQFCPVAKACELLCERWTMILVRELVAGSRRFNDLRRGVPLMSPTLLSRRLKDLTKAGVVRRVREPDGSRAYELTPAGLELRPMIELMGQWGHRWVDSDFADEDLDVGLLMWDMRRGVDASRFPSRRVVVQFEFFDARLGLRHWWLVCDQGEVDLCRDDPGHDVDLLVRATVRSLTSVWMRRRSFGDAQRSGELKVLGDPRLGRNLPAWLAGSPLARQGEQSLRERPPVRSAP